MGAQHHTSITMLMAFIRYCISATVDNRSVSSSILVRQKDCYPASQQYTQNEKPTNWGLKEWLYFLVSPAFLSLRLKEARNALINFRGKK